MTKSQIIMVPVIIFGGFYLFDTFIGPDHLKISLQDRIQQFEMGLQSYVDPDYRRRNKLISTWEEFDAEVLRIQSSTTMNRSEKTLALIEMMDQPQMLVAPPR